MSFFLSTHTVVLDIIIFIITTPSSSACLLARVFPLRIVVPLRQRGGQPITPWRPHRLRRRRRRRPSGRRQHLGCCEGVLSPAVLNLLPRSDFGRPEMHPSRVLSAMALGCTARSTSQGVCDGSAGHGCAIIDYIKLKFVFLMTYVVLCALHYALRPPQVRVLLQLWTDSARCRAEAVCARPR